MPSSDLHMLVTAVALLGGAGVFLRVVAGEKHRRDQWLRARLEQKLKEQKEQQARREVERAAARQQDAP